MVQCSAVLCSAVQYCAVKCCEVHHCSVLCSAVQYSAVQCSAIHSCEVHKMVIAVIAGDKNSNLKVEYGNKTCINKQDPGDLGLKAIRLSS